MKRAATFGIAIVWSLAAARADPIKLTYQPATIVTSSAPISLIQPAPISISTQPQTSGQILLNNIASDLSQRRMEHQILTSPASRTLVVPASISIKK